jgi:transposase
VPENDSTTSTSQSGAENGKRLRGLRGSAGGYAAARAQIGSPGQGLPKMTWTPVAPLIRLGIDLGLVGRKNKAGFEVAPQRWRSEETFGALGRSRRLLVDHEGATTLSRAMTLLAAPFLTGNRCERAITTSRLRHGSEEGLTACSWSSPAAWSA